MKLKQIIFKYPTIMLKKMRVLGALSIRLTKLTGKSDYPLHPKHLVRFENPWYLPYLTKSDTVLDIGCGNGQHTLIAAALVAKIIGIDLRAEPIALARQIAKDRGQTNATFQVADAQKRLGFKSGSFDKILILDVLEHMSHRDLVLSEIHRLLKKRGLLLLAIPNRETSWKKWQQSLGIASVTDPDHKIEYTRQEIIDAVKYHGFILKKIMPITYDTPLAPFIDFVGGLSLSAYKKLIIWKTQRLQKKPEETIGFRLILQKK